jgi:hypothetical protein
MASGKEAKDIGAGSSKSSGYRLSDTDTDNDNDTTVLDKGLDSEPEDKPVNISGGGGPRVRTISYQVSRNAKT